MFLIQPLAQRTTSRNLKNFLSDSESELSFGHPFQQSLALVHCKKVYFHSQGVVEYKRTHFTKS